MNTAHTSNDTRWLLAALDADADPSNTTTSNTTSNTTSSDTTTGNTTTSNTTSSDTTTNNTTTSNTTTNNTTTSNTATGNTDTMRRRRLIAAARAEGLIDVAYRSVDSPLGSLLLAATPLGVVRVGFTTEGHDRILDHLASVISPRVLHDPAALDDAACQLDEYFAGRRQRFDLALDRRLASGFRREVLTALAGVAYGATVSYAALAAAAGRPTAVRAAASACSHNPLPVLLPCHRVVRADGSPGEYLGGRTAKQALLRLEQLGAA